MNEERGRVIPFRLPPERRQMSVRRRAAAAARSATLRSEAAALFDEFFNSPSITPDIREQRLAKFVEISLRRLFP